MSRSDTTTRRRWTVAVVCAVVSAVAASLTVSLNTYDGASRTQRVSGCLAAAGYDVHVWHDDGKEPVNSDAGLLGPLVSGDYQARPASDSISVMVSNSYEVAVVTVQDGRSRFVLEHVTPRQARSIRGCVS